jgi:uncharacterized membrane protein
MFSLFKKKEFFSKEEKERIVAAIRTAEKRTSGEVRVFVESRCKFIDPLERAEDIFSELQMRYTVDRNAVLLYVALKDKQLAIYADSGIHEKMGTTFWEEVVNKILSQFDKENYANGMVQSILEIGKALEEHFLYHKDVDKNELPDEIIFGN